MGISQEDYKNYYYGASAELFIQSEIYAFGYEAYKAQPDIGFDICAHNSALVNFRKIPRQTFNIQVKARLVNSERVFFLLSPADLNLLATDETGAFVGVLMRPGAGRMWNPFNYWNHRESSLMIDNSIADDCEKYQLSHDTRISFKDADSKYNIVAYDRTYFWLSTKHISRLTTEGFFTDVKIDGKPFKQLSVIPENDSIVFQDSNGNPHQLVCEMTSIKYLLDDDVICKDELDKGYLFSDDGF